VRVTGVRVSPGDTGGPRPDGATLIAYASITLDHTLVVSHIRVVDMPDGKRVVAMPSKLTPAGHYRDITYATEEQLRQEIRGAVLDAVKSR
jgi:DNA-binding cell septation regulator SpoVG